MQSTIAPTRTDGHLCTSVHALGKRPSSRFLFFFSFLFSPSILFRLETLFFFSRPSFLFGLEAFFLFPLFLRFFFFAHGNRKRLRVYLWFGNTKATFGRRAPHGPAFSLDF